jgi:hypothetical protein
MADNLAVIQATFSDWRTVKGRKQLQLIFEVPIEQQGDVLARLGAPSGDSPKWCAIALLAPNASAPAPVQNEKIERGKAAYAGKNDMEKAATRAAMLCKDRQFQAWLVDEPSEHQAATEVKRQLRIQSRSEIATDQQAYRKFLALETEFRVATGQMADPR